MITLQEARGRVARGAEWLDAQRELAGSWPTVVNLASLDQEDPCFCVYGQVFGEFASRDHFYGEVTVFDLEHGFILGELDYTDDDDDEFFHEGYATLTQAWHEEITSRLGATNQEA